MAGIFNKTALYFYLALLAFLCFPVAAMAAVARPHLAVFDFWLGPTPRFVMTVALFIFFPMEAFFYGKVRGFKYWRSFWRVAGSYLVINFLSLIAMFIIVSIVIEKFKLVTNASIAIIVATMLVKLWLAIGNLGSEGRKLHKIIYIIFVVLSLPATLFGVRFLAEMVG